MKYLARAEQGFAQDLEPYHWKVFFQTTLLFGSKQEPMNMILDTGASWTWVYADDCVESEEVKCSDKKFHPKMSTSFK